jgi:hypothetical protein
MRITNSLDWAHKSTEMRKLVNQVAGAQYDKSITGIIHQVAKKVQVLSNLEVTARRTRKSPLSYNDLLDEINKDLEDVASELLMITLSK